MSLRLEMLDLAKTMNKQLFFIVFFDFEWSGV